VEDGVDLKIFRSMHRGVFRCRAHQYALSGLFRKQFFHFCKIQFAGIHLLARFGLDEKELASPFNDKIDLDRILVPIEKQVSTGLKPACFDKLRKDQVFPDLSI